jgi:hypothetical protein
MSLIDELPPLTDEERALLDKVVLSLHIMADLSRSDLLLYRALDVDRAVVVAHAQPHSVSSVHAQSQTGQGLSRREFPLLSRVLAGQRDGGATTLGQPGETKQKEILSVRNSTGAVIAALCIETTIVEVARHHKRSPVFRAALRDLQQMLVRGEIKGSDSLSSFGEHDGILFVDARARFAMSVASPKTCTASWGMPRACCVTRLRGWERTKARSLPLSKAVAASRARRAKGN